jgi:hypothetical protein
MNEPFAITDCAIISISTGEKAQNLRELKDRLQRLDDPGIMYYHFWDALLRPRFIDPEYRNDFAAWTYHNLRDRTLAERLSIINPTRYKRMDDLRLEIIDIIEERMDEPDFIHRGDADHPFFFGRSQIVVFDTDIRIDTPEKLFDIVPRLSPSSIFYHFIDSRRRTTTGENDFSEWLWSFGDAYRELAEEIAAIDPYFNSLTELRDELAAVFSTNEKESESS